MSDFNDTNWNSDFNYLKSSNDTGKISVQTKKTKGWIMALAGGLVGAFLMLLLSPVVTPFTSKMMGGNTSLTYSDRTAPQLTTVTYEPNNKTVLSAVEIGKMVGPAVVGIETTVQKQSFFGMSTSSGSGSGIVVTEDGYIVTNEHVVSGAANIKVVLSNNEEYSAKLIGSDTQTDIAVIKIDASGLTTAVLGSSSALQTGETVVAIGNPLGINFAGSLTQGIVSALNRQIVANGVTYNAIQTDAAINPGNSGGALVNCYGEVIGINSVKIASSEVEGLGFAIPIDDVKTIIEDFIQFGYVKNRVLVGVSIAYVNADEAKYYDLSSPGLYVSYVYENSGAYQAGIKKGDIITKCNGTIITSEDEFMDIKNSHKIGDTLTLTINRNGTVNDFKVVLTEDTSTAAR